MIYCKKTKRMADMKKRFAAVLLILALVFCTASCRQENPAETVSTETENNTEETGEKDISDIKAGEITRLFKTAFADGQTLPENRYLAFGDGILCFLKCEEGYTVGYFDLKNSILSENLMTVSSADGAVCHRLSGVTGYLIADGRCFFIDASSTGTQGVELPEGASFNNALFDEGGAVIYEDGWHILTAGADFETQYVLCEKSALPDYAGLLGFDKQNSRIYYATGDGDRFTGYAYFEYGSHQPLGRTELEFDDSLTIDGGLLLVKNGDDGQKFMRVDFDGGETAVYAPGAAVNYHNYSASEDGRTLALYLSPDGKLADGYIDIADMTTGERLKRFSVESDAFNPRIVLSPDGEYVFFGVKEKSTDTVGATEETDDDYTGELTELIKIR